MSKIDATLEAVAIQIVFFVLSILGAWVVLIILKGTASIKNKGAQFGGAAAMFVAMFILLNRYVPEMRDGILTEVHAAQAQAISTRTTAGIPERIDIYLSPNQQKITRSELIRLDKNKYVVDQDLGVALLQPPNDDWSTGVIESFDTVSVSDVPAVQIGIGMYKTFSDEGIKANAIFALREKRVNNVTLNENSEIRGARLDFNPFADVVFLQTLLLKQMEAGAAITGETIDRDAIEKFAKTKGPELSSGFDKLLKKSIPITKKIQNGVYVATFDVEKSSGGGFAALLKGGTPLDRAIQSMAFGNVEIGTARNLKIDQAQGVVSFEASQRLTKVILNGKETDVTLNNLGFLIAAENRIVLVQLLVLDAGEGLSTSLFLKKVMDTLYFTM